MSARALLCRPTWLPRPIDDTYYVGTTAITDGAWESIFNNLSKYPDLDFGLFDVDDPDTRDHIRRRLAYLLPDSNHQYSNDQVAVWQSLMASPLTVSTEDLQKVVAMEDFRYPSTLEHDAAPNPRGFFIYTWTMLVSEFDVLVQYFKREERTVRELVAWDEFIADNKLKHDDQITIRYVGSCAISEWSAKSAGNICDQTEDARSGILADFFKALVCVLPTVAATLRCHLIRHVITSAEDDHGLHELMHSALIEFFGASFVLNRHPNNRVSEVFTEHKSMLAKLNLRFDKSTLEQGLRCPVTIAAQLQDHFERIKDYLQLDEAKCAALRGQSIPRCYKRDRAIMIIAARSMHISDYMHGRPFSLSHDPDNQLIGQLLSQFNNVNLLAMHAEPFAYYCLAPWPRHESLEKAIVTFGKQMAAFVVNKSGYSGEYITEVFLDEAGQPIRRQIGNHHFIHVPLLDPSRCRYGIASVDEAARNFMQTSFGNAMLIADKVMQALDDPDAIEREITRLDESDSDSSNEDTAMSVLSEEDEDEDDGDPPAGRPNPVPNSPPNAPSRPHEQDDSQAICNLAMELYEKFLNTHVGEYFCGEVEEDSRALGDEVDKEPLFIL
ncbi:hypothetical protein EKO27_g6794 [Xylaria grammica]|uniref:Uncharacterized protein n=1 Tax=Xylaria grammica TaxID=363999 RepID=A0A439D256_9PEZI|nr:hypothetical protein EKO27_g6794 [Xylaria grammica]